VFIVALLSAMMLAYGSVADVDVVPPLGISAIAVAIALLITLIVVESLDVTLPIGGNSLRFATSAPIMVAATIHFGVLIGSMIVLCGLIIDEVQHRRALIKSAANVGTYLLATSAAGFIYWLLADSLSSPLASLSNFGAATAAGLAYSLLGSWSMALIVSAAIGESPFSMWKESVPALTLDFVSVPTLGGLFVVLASENAIAVLLLLLPLLAPQIAYRTLQRAQQNIRETIESLADAIEQRDRYTANHSARVAGYTRSILDQMPEIPSKLADTIMAAARIHDVGKVSIKDAILLKPGPLTVQERLDFQTHTVVGAEIVARIIEYRLCAAIIRHHHERWDGGGYPDGLSGTDIPIGARIICVADAFDAMTSDRPYRRAMSAEAAIEEVRRNAGRQFDPNVVAAFERVMATAPQPQPEFATAPFAQVNPTFVG
jgi:hypothetical protein